MASPVDTLRSLNSARDIVLRDHTLYPQVVPGVLQVIAPAAQIELRRWGADFLAETFASQAVTADEKQQMSRIVLDTLQGYLNRKELMGEDEDISVVKSAVQCAASIYPYVFRHTVTTPQDSETWGKIAKIKSSILRKMDTANRGVRICCIKFVACVVQIQTPGLIADPRRPEHNEISLALVPRDHPVIPPANLEAEASGLLDRLLGILQDNPTDALIVTATLNSLATLVQKRASISSKILSAILSFNPLKLASTKALNGRDKVTVRSMTRTTISFLLNCLKRNPNNAFASRIQQHVDRLKHILTEALSENNPLKRPAPDEPVDGLDDAKRQRLDMQAMNGTTLQQQTHGYPPLPSGQASLAQLWTLTNDQSASSFHAERLPPQVVTQLIPALMASTLQEKIDQAVYAVRSRWLDRVRQGASAALDAPRLSIGDDDDDDYDPSLPVDDDTDQVMNGQDLILPNGISTDVAIGTFKLPPPGPLTDEAREDYSKTALTRVFRTLANLDREAKTKGKLQVIEHGFNRLPTVSVSGHDREGWITLLTRVATRACFDLGDADSAVKREGSDQSLAKKGPSLQLTLAIREALLSYVMENFRGRIDVAILWLNEEWYSDRLRHKQRQLDGGDEEEEDQLSNYWHWTLRLLDAMMPYLDIKDGRILIRFLSEVPAINEDVLKRVKKIAEDPERVQITTNALLYLVMFRPPVRQLAIDCAEEMYKENKDARNAAKKILGKWRPAVIEQAGPVEVKAGPPEVKAGPTEVKAEA